MCTCAIFLHYLTPTLSPTFHFLFLVLVMRTLDLFSPLSFHVLAIRYFYTFCAFNVYLFNLLHIFSFSILCFVEGHVISFSTTTDFLTSNRTFRVNRMPVDERRFHQKITQR